MHPFRIGFHVAPNRDGTQLELIYRMADGARVPERIARDEPFGARQPGGPGTHWVGVAAGWHSFVDALEAHVSDAAPRLAYKDLASRYDELLRAYHGD